MTPTDEVDIHSDSGYRRLTGDADDDEKGYGIRGANLLRRGNAHGGRSVVHLVDIYCWTNRLQVRSSYSAETPTAAHNLKNCYPTIAILREIKMGATLAPEALKNVLE